MEASGIAVSSMRRLLDAFGPIGGYFQWAWATGLRRASARRE
jgi:predicted flavoprotein YhiN